MTGIYYFESFLKKIVISNKNIGYTGKYTYTYR